MMTLALIKTVTWNLILITVGSVICTIAINGILIPHRFISGGFTGLAMLIHYLVPFFSVGVVYFILNIPVYILGWKFVGRRFFLYSIGGLFIFSATVTWIHLRVPIQDKFLSALLAGIISGVGAGIILRSLGSAGGLDILSIQEVSRLKQLVRQIDPNAFVVISDTLEVMGQRIGNQPHW
jgi:uncharacterized membrane-anchored protein YitT (DUF2179 family)